MKGEHMSKVTLDLDKYKAYKMKILERDFWVRMTDEEIEHMNSLPSEIRVDAYVHDLLRKRYN